MSKRKVKDYLEDIIEAINASQEFIIDLDYPLSLSIRYSDNLWLIKKGEY